MTMTDNASDTLAPFTGDTSPLLFGIEHEYNTGRSEEESGCDCEDCVAMDHLTPGYREDCDDEVYYYAPSVRPQLPAGWAQHEEHCGWEVKTPPMTDIGLAVDTFRAVEEQIGEGHDDCGLHIHLNADPDRGPAVNLAKFHQAWIAHRPTLWRYCPSPNGGTGIRGGREYAETLPDDTLRWLNSSERYLEVNHTAIDAHTTVEVRLAAGTEDYDAFERWLRLVIAVGVESLFEGDPLAEYEPWVAQTTTGPWSSTLYLNAAGKHLVRLGNAEAAVRAIAVARAA